MSKWFAKMLTEKVVGVLLFLAAAGIVFLVWRYHEHLPSWATVGRFLVGLGVWLVATLLLPWATFFLVAWVSRADNNWPAVLVLAAWAMADAVVAWWLVGSGAPTARWLAALFAFGFGALYNLIAANQIARRFQR